MITNHTDTVTWYRIVRETRGPDRADCLERKADSASRGGLARSAFAILARSVSRSNMNVVTSGVTVAVSIVSRLYFAGTVSGTEGMGGSISEFPSRNVVIRTL